MSSRSSVTSPVVVVPPSAEEVGDGAGDGTLVGAGRGVAGRDARGVDVAFFACPGGVFLRSGPVEAPDVGVDAAEPSAVVEPVGAVPCSGAVARVVDRDAASSDARGLGVGFGVREGVGTVTLPDGVAAAAEGIEAVPSASVVARAPLNARAPAPASARTGPRRRGALCLPIRGILARHGRARKPPVTLATPARGSMTA